jgi:exopolyphosphatase / guanosine-5'-triphosphate,3'-diphosphate pyrophosphatase
MGDMTGNSHSGRSLSGSRAIKRAIIDIGSNTVRLVIYNGPPRAPIVILNEKVSAKLGRELSETGRLADKAVETALAALARFAKMLTLSGVSSVECVATAAARDAANGPEFLDAVRSLGLEPRVLSGEQEAKASATSVLAAFPGATGTVGDLGGGSLELVGIDGKALAGGITLPYGTLRLPALRASGGERFATAVRQGLLDKGWKSGKGQPLYIVGGSWRALALQAMRRIDWPLDDPHGFEISAEEVLRTCRVLEKGKVDDPDPRISSSRLATLPDAAALLGQLVERIQPSSIVFSSWGLREGLLFAQLDPETRALDPMLAGVEAFVAGSLVESGHARKVAAWVAPLFDLAGQEALHLGATMLALSAMRSEPNMRTEQAMGWALRKRWVGLDARGRAVMAMTVLANSGITEVPPEFGRLATRDDLNQAIGWGLALRLCRRLTACTDEALAQTALRREGGRIVLTLEPAMEALYANAMAKDMRKLGEWLGLEWDVKVAEGV